MPDIKPGVVGSVMASLLSPASGLTPKGAITIPGIRTVLELRTRYGKPGAALDNPQKYVDLRYYDEAAAR